MVFVLNKVRQFCQYARPQKAAAKMGICLLDSTKLVSTQTTRPNGQFRIEVAGSVFSIDKDGIKLSGPIMKLTVKWNGKGFQLVLWNDVGKYRIIY